MEERPLSSFIEENMRLKTTGELVGIWKANNRAEWTDEAFLVIKKILLERMDTLPAQNLPNFVYIDTSGRAVRSFFTSTWFLTTGLGFCAPVIILIGLGILRAIFGKEIPSVYLILLLVLTVPLLFLAGLFMILRNEKWITLLGAVIFSHNAFSGVILMLISGLAEIYLLYQLVSLLFYP